ncbi:MAG TPA: MerR family transcriptional regulator [Myxococcaceae bacterium]|nr:MerR family transcriptional regulator [Myxococcaceae bacterium]
MQEHSFRIRKAAELSGVTEDLIRAWERRYGVLTPRRTPGGYRVYSDEDIAVLRRLRRLTEEGMSIAEAARLVPSLRKEVEQASLGAEVAAVGSAPVDAWRAQILEAARNFDQRRVETVLDQAFAALPALTVLESVLMPLMQEVGVCWQEGKLSVAEEHLTSMAVRTRLVSLLHGAPQGTRKHVVCACLPDEQHEIGLLGAALRFRHAGMRVTLLGQRTPAAELEETLRRIKPDVVALSCAMDPGKETLEALLRGVLAALPPGSSAVIGGRAVLPYAELCRGLGVRVYLEPQDWERVLG